MKLTETLDPKFERLLRLGFADPRRLELYKRVFKDTPKSINNGEYRPIILDVLDKLIQNTIKDKSIYNRTEQNLMQHPLSKKFTAKLKEEHMTPLDTIKELVLEKNLQEAAVKRTGRNLRQSVGTVSTRRTRRGTKKARASNPDYIRKLIIQAKKRIVKSQMKLADNRENQHQNTVADQDYKYKLQNAQHKAQQF